MRFFARSPIPELAVAGVLSRGPRTAAAMQEETGLRSDVVRRNLARLTRVGIVAVEADRRTYRLREDALRRAAADAGPTREPGLALGAVDDEEESVLRQYFGAAGSRRSRSGARSA